MRLRRPWRARRHGRHDVSESVHLRERMAAKANPSPLSFLSHGAAEVPPARATRCFGALVAQSCGFGAECGLGEHAARGFRFAKTNLRPRSVKSRRMISVLVLGRAWLAFNVANPPPPRRRNRPLAPSQDFPHVICILSKSLGYAPFCPSFSHRSWGQTPFLF